MKKDLRKYEQSSGVEIVESVGCQTSIGCNAELKSKIRTAIENLTGLGKEIVNVQQNPPVANGLYYRANATITWKNSVVTETTTKTDSNSTKIQINNVNVTTESLLKRAFIFLEDEEWEKADAYFESVLDQDPENPEAYIGKLMVNLKVNKKENLAKCKTSFENNSNYIKAIKFADNNLKNELTNYSHNAILEITHDKYIKAINQFNNIKSPEEADEIKEIFISISDYKDSETMIQECENKKKSLIYVKAVKLMDEGNYIGAEIYLKKIKNYKDSSTLLEQCKPKAEERRKEVEKQDKATGYVLIFISIISCVIIFCLFFNNIISSLFFAIVFVFASILFFIGIFIAR